jgi:hypothetical protein|tara:strand:- start:68 stop:307 length:240 start_codon:yes stop_codon:yes gene_type:complete
MTHSLARRKQQQQEEEEEEEQRTRRSSWILLRITGQATRSGIQVLREGVTVGMMESGRRRICAQMVRLDALAMTLHQGS